MEINDQATIELETILHQIITTPTLNAKWLNTLSYMENCGARKIARCEHPTRVKEEMLKHAAEEFRHAYFLKQQIRKITEENFHSYVPKNLLGQNSSLKYLDALDIQTCRYLKETANLNSSELKSVAYLLVTHAIEVRASFLYPLYDKTLRKLGSNIYVKSIVLEEEEHLHEMTEALKIFPRGNLYKQQVSTIEAALYSFWITAIKKSITSEIKIKI